MFWDSKKLEEQRRANEMARQKKLNDERRLAAVKKKVAQEKKKAKIEAEERRRQEEGEQAKAPEEQQAKPAARVVLNRGFGFGGSEYQEFKTNHAGPGQRLPAPGSPGLPAGTRPKSNPSEHEPVSGKAGGAAEAIAPLRRPY